MGGAGSGRRPGSGGGRRGRPPGTRGQNQPMRGYLPRLTTEMAIDISSKIRAFKEATPEKKPEILASLVPFRPYIEKMLRNYNVQISYWNAQQSADMVPLPLSDDPRSIGDTIYDQEYVYGQRRLLSEILAKLPKEEGPK